MSSDRKIRWTDESIRNLESIIAYLETNWTEKEVSDFKKKLAKLLDVIREFPMIFPPSEFAPHLRKSVLSEQTSILYSLEKDAIYLVYLFDTRQSPKSIK